MDARAALRAALTSRQLLRSRLPTQSQFWKEVRRVLSTPAHDLPLVLRSPTRSALSRVAAVGGWGTRNSPTANANLLRLWYSGMHVRQFASPAAYSMLRRTELFANENPNDASLQALYARELNQNKLHDEVCAGWGGGARCRRTAAAARVG